MANTPTQPCASFALPQIQLPFPFNGAGIGGITVPGNLFPPIPPIVGIPCCQFHIPLPIPPLPVAIIPGLSTLLTPLSAALLALQQILPALIIPTCNL